MPQRNGARVLVDCLIAQGVDTIFGVPGESYLEVLDALHDEGDRIRLVPNRQEGGAAFMAAAWGKLTGEPGICFVTRGPGATNASIGVHAAQQDSSPMVLFVGQIDTAMREREAFQELDYRAVFGTMAKWATEIDAPGRIPEMIARAFAVAQSGRPGPVVVALPEDVLAAATDAVAGPRVRIPRAHPVKETLREILDRLKDAERPLVLVGGPGWTGEGRAALRQFVEKNNLPVLADFRCQDILDNDLPSYAGDAGLGKIAAARDLIETADTVLALGVTFGEILFDGYSLLDVPTPEPVLIHVHPDVAVLNKVYSADIPVIADPDTFVRAIAGEKIEGNADWAERTGAAREAWLANIETPPQPGTLDLGEVMRHLQENLPADAILTNGAGNFSIWSNRHFRFTGDQRLVGPQSGAMGYGLPAAIAARIRFPERVTVCIAGDGDFQMTMQELGCARQAKAWPIVLLVNNSSYGTIRMHQERAHPGRVSFTEIDNPDFCAIARAYGLSAQRVENTADFSDAFAQALASPTGAVIELVVSPDALTPRETVGSIREKAQGGG